MRRHYQELFETSSKELSFEKNQSMDLLEIIQDVIDITNDNLASAILENAVNRYNLNKLIHIREVFKNPDKLK